MTGQNNFVLSKGVFGIFWSFLNGAGGEGGPVLSFMGGNTRIFWVPVPPPKKAAVSPFCFSPPKA